MRNESDLNSNFKSFENKNEKISFLNSRILIFIKFNYNNNVKMSHIFKNNKNKRKNEFETKYKNLV